MYRPNGHGLSARRPGGGRGRATAGTAAAARAGAAAATAPTAAGGAPTEAIAAAVPCTPAAVSARAARTVAMGAVEEDGGTGEIPNDPGGLSEGERTIRLFGVPDAKAAPVLTAAASAAAAGDWGGAVCGTP